MTTVTPAITPERDDPMPAAALGMWLFIAGEAMFFAGLLSAFIVLQSVPGERLLFVRSAAVVSRPLTIVAAGLLVAGSLVLRRGKADVGRLAIFAGLAVAFLGVQAGAGWRLLSHDTVATASAVYDGTVARRRNAVTITGVRAALPPSFDVSRTMPADLRRGGTVGQFAVPALDVRLEANYGPSRNNYFACYFLVTAAHALHGVGGLVALGWLIVRARRRTATDVQVRAVTLYWQFVNGVGLLSLLLLSLG